MQDFTRKMPGGNTFYQEPIARRKPQNHNGIGWYLLEGAGSAMC